MIENDHIIENLVITYIFNNYYPEGKYDNDICKLIKSMNTYITIPVLANILTNSPGDPSVVVSGHTINFIVSFCREYPAVIILNFSDAQLERNNKYLLKQVETYLDELTYCFYVDNKDTQSVDLTSDEYIMLWLMDGDAYVNFLNSVRKRYKYNPCVENVGFSYDPANERAMLKVRFKTNIFAKAYVYYKIKRMGF